MIGEPQLTIARGADVLLPEARSMWRVSEGYVAVEIATVDATGVDTGERGFLFNAIAGDVIPGGGFAGDVASHVIVATAAANAVLDRVDPDALSGSDREKLQRRFSTLFARMDATPFLWSDAPARTFVAQVESALDAFGRAYVETLRLERRREVARTTEAVAADREALYREAFEASHILDRHPIPIDPTDDAVTAAARIVIDRLGVKLVRPIKAERDYAASVRAIAMASRLVMRRIVLRGRWWRSEHGPMVGFAGSDGRPVALVPKRRGHGYDMIDPLDPRRQETVDDAIAGSIAGVAYMFSPTLPHRGAGVLALLSLGLRDAKRDFVRVLLLGLVSGLLASILPLAIAPLVDTVLPGGLRGILIETTVLLVIAILAAAAIDAVRNISVVRVKTRLSSQMQQGVMHRLVGLPPAFFRRYAVGDLTGRALGVDTVEQYIGDATLTAILTAIFSVVSYGVIVYEDPLVGAVCGVIALITIGAFASQAAMLLNLRRKSLELAGGLSGFVYQTLVGIAKIRAAAARNRVYVRWLHRFLETRRTLAAANKIAYRYGIFSQVWPSVATLAIVVTIIVSRNGVFEPGKFFTILAAFTQLLGAMIALGSSVSSMVAVVPVYERLKPILDAAPERDELGGDPGTLSGAISIRDVSFSYEGASRPALSHVSQEIPAGSFVAIVGPSGSGKSTLLRLLLGFEEASGGSISYDNHALDSLDVVSVRRQIGAVLQTAKLLPGSIFDNIAGNALLTRDEAWEAARRVGLARDIEAMPMKLDTVIGANGAGLSGGQRQRIVIARAIAFAPKLIFFDEATSALDNATQAVVSETLSGMNATRIVIAHRLSTVVDADRIIVMEDGRIVQQGTYRELVETPGPFQTLAERQQL